MHKTRHTRRIPFLSIFILGLGIYFLFQFLWFDVRFIPLIISLIFLLIILPAAINSRRYRRTHRPSYERKQYEIYTPTPSPYKPQGLYERNNESTSHSEQQDFTPSMKMNPPIANSRANFCNFCGAKIIEESNYCVNCGFELN